MEFKDYCSNLFGQYKGNLGTITKDSTDRLFKLVHNNNLEVSASKNITQGKFYLIKYNYNGNNIWCPIFVIDDRYLTKIQKRVIYSINLEYLPYDFKILFFDIIFSSDKRVVDFNKKQNDQNKNVNFEKPFNVKFEEMYKTLKRYRKDYCITAYDYMKIDGMDAGRPRMFGISTNFAPRFMYVDTKRVNIKSMKDLSLKLEEYEIKKNLDDLIEIFENIRPELEEKDADNYYRKLKELEGRYKLYENL